MKPILVVYATRQGHTRRVAEYIVDAIRTRELEAELHDAREVDEPVDLAPFEAAVLLASVHMGKHEKEISTFVERERDQLERMPTAFLSVSMAEAGAEDRSSTPEKRTEAAQHVAEQMEAFFETTGWHPDRSTAVAGALMYTKYNLLVRWVMKRIARSGGLSTDTSQDHVYTDWDALDRFVEELTGGLRETERQATAS